MSDDLKAIYHTRQVHVAHMLKHLLDEYGIAASVPAISAVDEIESPTQVYVYEKDVEVATRIADAFDRHVISRRDEARDDGGDETDDDFYFWIDWPKCPECKALRQTRCDFCQTSGTDFLLADAPPVLAGDEVNVSDLDYDVLLMCHTCDEPFEPVFYRNCQWCSHEFADGYANDEHQTAPIEWTSRTIAVTVGLLATAAAMLIYVWLIYQ